YPVALIRGEAQMNPMFSPRRRRACEKPSSGGMVLGRKLAPLVGAYIDVRPELPRAWKGMRRRLRSSTTTAVASLCQKVQFIPQASRILTRKVASVSMCVGNNEANGAEGLPGSALIVSTAAPRSEERAFSRPPPMPEDR